MFGFLIKKAFFDMWDNLFRVILLNLGFVAVIGFAVTIPYIGRYLTFVPQALLLFLMLAISLAVFFVFCGAASCVAMDISNYEEPGFRDFFRYLKETYRGSLGFALINTVVFFLLSLAMPFYLSMKSLIGPLAFAFLFWLGVIWAVSIQFYFPVQSRFDTNLKKNLKKIFLIFFDNTGFSLGVFLGTLIIFAASTFTALMLPGIATILVWPNVALKLRMLKYDYLEEHPEANRKKIPWSALLVEERERVGKRTLKGMIFPWKE
jgi:uncharacterized membrane protein YesL